MGIGPGVRGVGGPPEDLTLYTAIMGTEDIEQSQPL